jgi:hypothetical protein
MKSRDKNGKTTKIKFFWSMVCETRIVLHKTKVFFGVFLGVWFSIRIVLYKNKVIFGIWFPIRFLKINNY